MAKQRTFSPAQLADVRRRLETTSEHVSAIAASIGCDRGTIYGWARKGNWTPRRERPPSDLAPSGFAATAAADEDALAMQPPHSNVAVARPTHEAATPPAFDQPALVRRLERAVEDEIGAVERLIAQLRMGQGRLIETERAARTLASLTRTLKEISGLRGADNADAEADDIPRDIDELRRVLAGRLDRLEREQGIAGGDASDDAERSSLRD